MRDSQKSRILRHLQSGKTITSLESFYNWTFTRLSSPIQLLRDDGWDIQSRILIANGGEEYSEYYLSSEIQGPTRYRRSSEKDINEVIDLMATYIMRAELGDDPDNGREVIAKLSQLIRHKDKADQDNDPIILAAKAFTKLV